MRYLLVLFLLWGIFACIAVDKTNRTQREAEQFLREFRQLELERSTKEQVALLADKYHGHWSLHSISAPGVPGCGLGSASVDFVFENWWLHWFLFAPVTTFDAGVDMNDNRVCYSGITFGKREIGFNGVSVQGFLVNPLSGPPFEVNLRPSATSVRYDVRATPAERSVAYSINLGCLSRLRGCNDTRDISPQLWQGAHEDGLSYWKSPWNK